MRIITAIGSALLLLPTTAGTVVVDIGINSREGTTVALAAGTYVVGYAGTAGGGAYDAFNPWQNVLNCDAAGGACQNGWSDYYAIDFGGAGGFDRTVGGYYDLDPVTVPRPFYDSAALALATYRAGPLTIAPIATYTPSVPVAGPVRFTLAMAASVNFYIPDDKYYGHAGGVSLDVSAVPEPAAWALMLAGFALTGAALRRRNVRVIEGIC